MKKNIPIYALLLMSLPLLSGCFQQAGEAFQPASSTEAPITIPTTPENNNGGNVTVETPPPIATNVPDFADTSVTPGIDITIMSPTRSLGATATLPETQPTNSDSVPTTEIQTFRTPVSPLGPVTSAPIMATVLATATPSGLITPTALPGIGGDTNAGGQCTYTIQTGDTLFRIATRNDTTVDAIASANPGININLIQPGQVITLPGCDAVGSGDVTLPTTAPEPSDNVPPGGTTYTVQSGDTLFAIAQRFGITVQEIVDANNMSNPNNLSVGQELIIPVTGS